MDNTVEENSSVFSLLFYFALLFIMLMLIVLILPAYNCAFSAFDTVGWAAGRAYGL